MHSSFASLLISFQVSKRLGQLERERQKLAENGLNVLARCSSRDGERSEKRERVGRATFQRLSEVSKAPKSPPEARARSVIGYARLR